MPGFFSPMGALGRFAMPAGSAAGTAYRGFQDWHQKQLDEEVIRQRQQLDQQRFQLDQRRESMQENEAAYKIWLESQAQLKDAEERQTLSEMLAALAKAPGLDPARKINLQAGSRALAAGADWGPVSAAMGFDAKNMLEQIKAMNLAAAGEEKKAKAGQERATTGLINKATAAATGADGGAADGAADGGGATDGGGADGGTTDGGGGAGGPPMEIIIKGGKMYTTGPDGKLTPYTGGH